MLKTVNFTTPNYTTNTKPAQNPQAVTHTASQPLKAAPAPLGRGAYGVKVNFGGVPGNLTKIAEQLPHLNPEQFAKIRAEVDAMHGITDIGTERDLPELATDINALPPKELAQTVGSVLAAKYANGGYNPLAFKVLATVERETGGLTYYGQELFAGITSKPINK